MRPVHLIAMCFLIVMNAVQGSRMGSRLGTLEDQVNDLKSFIYKELGYIRDEVKEISNRVEVLEFQNDTQNRVHIQERQSFEDEIRGDDNKPRFIATAEMGNIRKAFSKDKKDLHQLKQDVKGQLRELEEKIDTHLESLTSEVQQNIKYIHKNITLANASFLDIINTSTANVSIFSDNLRKELVEFTANTSKHLDLKLNETEIKMKQNITTTYRRNEDKLQSFMALADRTISDIMLKADNIVSLIRTNFSEMPTQIRNLSLEMDTVNQNVLSVEEKLTNDVEPTLSNFEKRITIIMLVTCNEYFIANNGAIKYDYYYPCQKDIRLANASPYQSTGVQGRLEVRHSNEWGTVCDDSFESGRSAYKGNNINVVCAIFGFTECEYVLRAGLGEGSGTTWMDEVECDGEESSFLQCPHQGWGVEDCTHGEDVGFKMWN